MSQPNNAQQPAAPRRSVWTPPRLILAAFVLGALALVFSPGCNPSDDTANINATASTNANANNGKAANTPAPGAPVPLPDKIKNTELTTLDGQKFKLADYEGKVVVVNLWASWCNPCRHEIPEMVKMYGDYKGRDVEVVGLTMEDDRGNTPEAVRQSVKDLQINYRVAWAEKDLYATLLAPGFQIPQTYIIDRQGRIRKKFIGGDPHIVNFLRATLDDILANKEG
ncbi:MAG: TlpA family protein disulfide reductase [Pyrinomonadaceae bacterium]